MEFCRDDRLFRFYRFLCPLLRFLKLKCEYTKHFDSVRCLRNAAAHNVCMLSNIKPATWFHSDVKINFELLGANLGIGQGIISSCLKIPLLNDFCVMLSNYTRLISSEPIKRHTFEELKEFFDNRMIYHKDYFQNNTTLQNTYQFARKVLDFYAGK